MANAIPLNVTERISERLGAAVWGQARRFFLMQRRLRSSEPTQILICAATGGAIGAIVAGLHWLIDFVHRPCGQ